MKSLKSLLMAMLLATAMQANEVPVKHQLDRATVFMQGAQLFHKADVMLEKGEQTLVFSSLTNQLQDGSVRVSGKGALTILSVKTRKNYSEAPIKDAEKEKLQTDIKSFEAAIEDNNLWVSVYSEEEDLLLKNKDIGGEDGVDMNQLKLATEFMRSRLSEIRLKKLELQRTIKKQQAELQNLRSQYNQIVGYQGEPITEILVKIAVEKPTRAMLEFSYNVASAGWSPTYDVRMTSVEAPLEIGYKARVMQNTGTDWKNVKLTLSSGNPNLSNNLPNIYPWYVDFEYAQVNISGAKSEEYLDDRTFRDKRQVSSTTAEVFQASDGEGVEIRKGVAAFTEKTTNFEYALALPYNIPGNGQPEEVHVRTENVPAAFEYRANLRADLTAYLVAKMYGWQDYNFVSGPAKLFNEGTFVGEIDLQLDNTTDTLVLSMGREDNIIIKRERMKDVTGTKFLGSTTNVNRGWKISVRNNKKQQVRLVVTDQIPVSRQKEIEVKLEKETDGKHDEATGFVVWQLQLAPATTQDLNLIYTLKYPKDRRVNFRD